MHILAIRCLSTWQRESESDYAVWLLDMYSEPCQTSNIEVFAKIINVCKLQIIFWKRSILDALQFIEYASEYNLMYKWYYFDF